VVVLLDGDFEMSFSDSGSQFNLSAAELYDILQMVEYENKTIKQLNATRMTQLNYLKPEEDILTSENEKNDETLEYLMVMDKDKIGMRSNWLKVTLYWLRLPLDKVLVDKKIDVEKAHKLFSFYFPDN